MIATWHTEIGKGTEFVSEALKAEKPINQKGNFCVDIYTKNPVLLVGIEAEWLLLSGTKLNLSLDDLAIFGY